MISITSSIISHEHQILKIQMNFFYSLENL